MMTMLMAALLAAGDLSGLTQALPSSNMPGGVCNPASDVVSDTVRALRIRRSCLAADGATPAHVEIITGHSAKTLGQLTRSMLGAVGARPHLKAETYRRREALLDSDANRMTVVSGDNAVVVIQCRDETFIRMIADSVNYNLLERASQVR